MTDAGQGASTPTKLSCHRLRETHKAAGSGINSNKTLRGDDALGSGTLHNAGPEQDAADVWLLACQSFWQVSAVLPRP